MCYSACMIIQLEHVDIFAKEILKKVEGVHTTHKATVVFLSGDLGSGKTTTTKAVAKALGVQEDVTSPTFVILKRYRIGENIINKKFENLIHIDAYRLKSYSELEKIKFEEYLTDEKNVIFIEWPEMVENEKLTPDVTVMFKHVEKEGERIVEII